MATFRPEVNYKNLMKHETSCGNQNCKVQLDSTNYGEMIDESKGYAPASSFFLACLFRNSSSLVKTNSLCIKSTLTSFSLSSLI